MGGDHLFHGHAGVKEHGEVAELVWELLCQHGEGHADAGQDGLGEGRADAETVDEVVDAVAEDDHPSHRGDLGAALLGLQGLHLLYCRSGGGGFKCRKFKWMITRVQDALEETRTGCRVKGAGQSQLFIKCITSS